VLYNYLTKYLLTCLITLIAFNSNAQLLDSIAFDTVPTYTLQQALKQDPLKVYKLSVKKQKLTELPSEIFAFKNLQYLDVSRNKLSKFPANITTFKYLQELDIAGNKIEVITKELGELEHLKKFSASQNGLVSIPAEIKNLKKLKHMDLWGNDIGSLPYQISELKNTLEILDLRVILMSLDEHKKIKELLPNTKIKFSKACNCGF
jgi:Leucine-rich repeat (LRR) protein